MASNEPFSNGDLGGIGADETSLRNESAGSLDLTVTEVDADDLVTKCGELAADRYPAPAAEIQYVGPGRKPNREGPQQTGVLRWSVVVTAIAIRHGVVSEAHEVDLLVGSRLLHSVDLMYGQRGGRPRNGGEARFTLG
jgi:hypothetical protein